MENATLLSVLYSEKFELKSAQKFVVNKLAVPIARLEFSSGGL